MTLNPEPLETHGEFGERTTALAQERKREAVAVSGQSSTQVEYPWRATLRSAVQALIGLVPVLILVAPEITRLSGELGLPDALAAWVAGAVGVTVAVAASITRISAIPQVDAWVRRWLPWLAPSADEGR